MKYAKEQLERPVMKIVRRLAAIEREEISLTAMNKKSTEEASSEFIIQLTALYEEGNNLIIDLLQSDLAFAVLGGNPFAEEDSHAENLRLLGQYFLEIYALDRMLSEIDRELPDEDVFYAGTYLVHRAAVFAADEAGYLDEAAEDTVILEGKTGKDLRWDEKKEKSHKSSKIVQLFKEED